MLLFIPIAPWLTRFAVTAPSPPPPRVQYVMLHAKREARAGRLAAAYKVLDKVRGGGTAAAVWGEGFSSSYGALERQQSNSTGLSPIMPPLLQAASPEDKPAAKDVLEMRAQLVQQVGSV